MEKGSFHSPLNLSTTHSTDELVKGIPLPNQLPRSMDFTDLPPAAMKSSTLEALISQNEDLMARLSVNLRKYNQMEEDHALLTKENQTFRARFETLREQYLVLKEKDSISTSKQLALAEELSTQHSQMQRLEKIYTELYVQAQGLQRRLIQLERYRVRMRKAAHQVQQRAKTALRLTEDNQRIQRDFEEMKRSLSASTMQTVNAYESKLGEARKVMEELRAKADERDTLFAERVRLDNQLLFEQRQSQMRSDDAQAEIDRLTSQNSELRVQLKETLVSNEYQNKELRELKQQVPQLQQSQKDLQDQVESLQILWAQKQKELDQSEDKNRALQKLNQSLSLNLNNQRKEMQSLKAEIDKDDFIAQEKIKTLLSEVQMLRRQLQEAEHREF
jgi:chromosome segregation ATPase